MKAEYILEQRQKDANVKDTQILRSLLSEEQTIGIECGRLVPICAGQKLNLDDEIKGTVLMLTPLQGG